MAARKRVGTKKGGKKPARARGTKTAKSRKTAATRPASRRGASVRKKKGAVRKAATKGTARKPTRRRVTTKAKAAGKAKARPTRARGGQAGTRKAAVPRRAAGSARPAPASPTPVPRPAPPRPQAGPGETLIEIGRVTHYFAIPRAAVVEITSGELAVGDTIRIKGHTTDLSEPVNSLQVDHKPVARAHVGEVVGLEVKDRVREHDLVYKLTTSF